MYVDAINEINEYKNKLSNKPVVSTTSNISSATTTTTSSTTSNSTINTNIGKITARKLIYLITYLSRTSKDKEMQMLYRGLITEVFEKENVKEFEILFKSYFIKYIKENMNTINIILKMI